MYSEFCCPTDDGLCEWDSSDLCASEGGPDCCKLITSEPTTSEPTTSEPTTAEPTTAEPTTAEPTTAEPTTSEPTTAEPTTSEPTKAEPTTSEPTTSEPTTAEPTTAEPTTDEPTTTTEEASWPTPRPTLKSAMKWEMIHPNYQGGDGELLWHVYYGDYSNDERFDTFRADEKWDATEIRPLIRSDSKFKRYANEKLYNDDATIMSNADETASTATSYWMWIVMMAIAVIVIFACWYRSSLVSKDEITGLLEESKPQYY
jgi:hypothetical protein